MRVRKRERERYLKYNDVWSGELELLTEEIQLRVMFTRTAAAAGKHYYSINYFPAHYSKHRGYYLTTELGLIIYRSLSDYFTGKLFILKIHANL